MIILSVDSSAKAASVSVAEENKIISEFFVNNALTHSQTLIPMVEQALKVSGLSMNDISAIAVNAGPGSFTGVRIGVAAVKGLAFKNNLPCISVSTLESMAYNMLGCDCIVCSVMDARCMQVYTALFDIKCSEVKRLSVDKAISLQELSLELEKYKNKRVILVGDGAAIAHKYLKGRFVNVSLAPINHITQTASSTALAAFRLYRAGKLLSCDELMPVYLRLPQAQRELNKKMGVKI